MPKFNIENSRMAKFFSSKDNTKYLQKFLDEKDIFHVNYGWWKTQGRIAADLTPTNRKGVNIRRGFSYSSLPGRV